jgi:KTSC domain
MVKAAAALFLSLLSVPVTSETVDVRGRGAVDLQSFECRDINRSSLIQRVCYDVAQAYLLVAVAGIYDGYCGVPVQTFDSFLGAPSMGVYLNRTIRGAASESRHGCKR